MSSADSESETAQLPEDLPPVQPPSAGFIVQLFVVPGMIVLAIVAVWALFGKLASGDQDWRGLVVELRHPNEHRRWRGALGLAQMLKADQELKVGGQDLAGNREIAQALSDVLTEELKRAGHSDDDLKYEAFLARTLGLFDLPDVVLPALREAMQSGVDRDVRKNAIGSVAVIADRCAARNEPLLAPELADELLKVSRDDDPLIRQLSAFTLGLFGDDWAKSRLEVMLGDSDADTRINAALGLARHGDSRGIEVFTEFLKSAGELKEAGSPAEYEQFLVLKNCLLGVERCANRLSPDQRREMIGLIQPLAAEFREPRIRVAAQSALKSLDQAR
jgi:hypothetical protein